MRSIDRFLPLTIWSKPAVLGGSAFVLGLALGLLLSHGDNDSQMPDGISDAQKKDEDGASIVEPGRGISTAPNMTQQQTIKVRLLRNGDNGTARQGKHLKYSFERQEYVHPRIVQELLGWISDPGQPVIAVDLASANRSNRFHGAFDVRRSGVEQWIWHDRQEEGFFAYRHIGCSSSGIHILKCQNNGGGSGVFCSIALLVFQTDVGLDTDQGDPIVRERVTLKILGSIVLGDRYSGKITYEENVLRIGPDTSLKKYGGRYGDEYIRIE